MKTVNINFFSQEFCDQGKQIAGWSQGRLDFLRCKSLQHAYLLLRSTREEKHWWWKREELWPRAQVGKKDDLKAHDL